MLPEILNAVYNKLFLFIYNTNINYALDMLFQVNSHLYRASHKIVSLYKKFKQEKHLQYFECIPFILLQGVCFFLLLDFDPFLLVTEANRGFQYFFFYKLNTLTSLNITFGFDGFSLVFILLTSCIFVICYFIGATGEAISTPKLTFIMTLFFLEIILFAIFALLDLFFFYLCFESSLIPMFFIVGYWGARARKIKAAFYLFLYTMSMALLTLFILLYLFTQIGSTFYPDLLNYNFVINEQFVLWLCFFFTFAVKIPIIPFHI